MEAVELGVTSFFGAVLSAMVFWLLAAVGELFVTLRCRRVLANAGRPTGTATLVMVLLLVVVVPFVAGFTGCAWSGQRSAAEGLEEADLDDAVAWTIHRGADQLREELRISPEDAHVLVELERVRTLARTRAAETDGALTELLEHAWWLAVLHALDETLPPKPTWDHVLAKIEDAAIAKVREQLDSHADGLRGSARTTLLLLLGFLVVVNGIAFYAVRRAAAGGAAIPPAPA